MEDRATRLNTAQLVMLVALRVAIGWHFLYEGLIKLFDPNWTSAGFLAASPLGIYEWILHTPWLLYLVDWMNALGLFLVGLALMLGLLTRAAIAAGGLLLLLYFTANPPLIGASPGMPTEGNYLWIDKNLIELLALGALWVLPTSHRVGLDLLARRLWHRIKSSLDQPVAVAKKPQELLSGKALRRRELFAGLATAPVVGGFVFGFLRKQGYESHEEKNLLALAGSDVDTVSEATVRTFQYSSLKDLKGELPRGRIGDLELSRMFLGGNLIGGWAHARDLIYVSKLVKTYHTDEKIFETFRMAELCGMNTVLTNPILCRVINEYWRKRGGEIQFISDCAFQGDLRRGIEVSVDGGAHACYVQGGIADRLVTEGKVEEIGEAVDYIRSFGVPAGIGAHALPTVQACVEAGLEPDFWVKTLHHCDYWSADPANQHDNIWCTDPEATAAYMGNLSQPWIAFKVLAAGAIQPEEGFRYAFENGADFICVGMYDFQIVDDVNLAASILNEPFDRSRPWRA